MRLLLTAHSLREYLCPELDFQTVPAWRPFPSFDLVVSEQEAPLASSSYL